MCKEGRYNLCPDVVFLSAPPIDGTFCDYVCVNENFLFEMPENLSFEEAALAEVVFETAGNKVTTAQMFSIAKMGGCAIQVGWPNGNVVEMNIADMIDKEINYKSVNRYANAFGAAITWLADGRIKTEEMMTHYFDLEHAKEAFEWALQHPHETVKVIVTN